MSLRVFLLLALGACSNDLPPPGTCDLATNGEMPTLTAVALAGHSTGFDDLRYSPQLGKVIAVPEGTARMYLIEPDTLDVTMIGVPGGSASADASATTIYVVDRNGDQIIAIDAVTLAETASHGTTGHPDYVRTTPTADEVWVTIPSRDRIEILDGTTLTPIDSVEIPGAPEGLTFDARGLAYTQSGGRMIQVDVARRLVIDEWDTGCGSSHGFPQVDETYGLAIAGCSSRGGVGITTTSGDKRSGFEAGGASAILAHNATTHHLFVRGDPGSKLDILAVCGDGGTSVLASVDISIAGHGATVDDRGHAWICDSTTGGVLRITDPFPTTH